MGSPAGTPREESAGAGRAGRLSHFGTPSSWRTHTQSHSPAQLDAHLLPGSLWPTRGSLCWLRGHQHSPLGCLPQEPFPISLPLSGLVPARVSQFILQTSLQGLPLPMWETTSPSALGHPSLLLLSQWGQRSLDPRLWAQGPTSGPHLGLGPPVPPQDLQGRRQAAGI